MENKVIDDYLSELFDEDSNTRVDEAKKIEQQVMSDLGNILKFKKEEDSDKSVILKQIANLKNKERAFNRNSRRCKPFTIVNGVINPLTDEEIFQKRKTYNQQIEERKLRLREIELKESGTIERLEGVKERSDKKETLKKKKV